MDAFGENWNKEFLDQIVESSLQNPSLDTATAEMDEEDDKVPPPQPKITNSIQCLEDVTCFLDSKGCTNEAGDAYKLLTSLK